MKYFATVYATRTFCRHSVSLRLRKETMTDAQTDDAQSDDAQTTRSVTDDNTAWSCNRPLNHEIHSLRNAGRFLRLSVALSVGLPFCLSLPHLPPHLALQDLECVFQVFDHCLSFRDLLFSGFDICAAARCQGVDVGFYRFQFSLSGDPVALLSLKSY